MESGSVDLIPLDVEPCVTRCSAESGPMQHGHQTTHRAPVRTELLLLFCSPLLASSLALLNQSRISTAAHSANGRIEGGKKKGKTFKSSAARLGAGRWVPCFIMRHLPCQLKANSGVGYFLTAPVSACTHTHTNMS